MEMRQRARKLNLRRRPWALTSNETVQMKKLRRLITVSCLKAKYDIENADFHHRLAWMAYRRLLGLSYMPVMHLPHSIDRKRDVASFDDIDCWTFFKCKKEDFPRLLRVLRMPEVCVLSNRIKMSGEEVFCRGMYELISGEDQHSVSRNIAASFPLKQFGKKQKQFHRR
jgi:hypothetical protein